MKNTRIIFKYLFASAVLLWTLSCTRKTPEIKVDETIIFSDRNIGNIADLISSVEFIPLENAKKAFMREPSQVIIEGGQVVVRDMYTHKVVVFSENGNYLFSIDRKGRGPQEYLELKNFAFDDESFYFIDNYTNKLRLYDRHTGGYKGEMNLPIVADDIEILDNGDFLLTVAPYGGKFDIKQSRSRIFITNNNLKIKEEMLSYPEGADDPIDKRYYFTEDKDNIYFQAGMDDRFYSFSKSDPSLRKAYFVDFGQKKVPDEFRNDYDASLPYRFMHETPYVTDNYMVFDINYDDYFEVFVYNRETGKWYMNDDKARHNFVLPVKYVQDKTIYSAIYEGFDSYMQLVENGFNRASPEIEEHMKNSGMVLVKYTLN